MAIDLTDEEFAALFAAYPQVRKAETGLPRCPHCGNPLSAENLASWNGSTEAGTDFCQMEITCDVCHQVAWRGGSWYPGIDDKEELLEYLPKMIEKGLAMT